MPLSRLATILIAILLLGEAGLALWRHLPIPVSAASVSLTSAIPQTILRS
jgi:hypothetical protein